jgi:iron complex outermembrane receptor protein/hemoglobin/transferrin/lactoferrin receptor protein
LTDPALEGALPDEALRVTLPRGQYLDGSTYISAGAFTELELVPIAPLTLRAGGRAAAIGAHAPGETVSSTAPVHARWGAVVGRAGVELQALDAVAFHLNFDQGFRAPNLDDLTSRQEVGSGFQFENPDLRAEHTDTLEFGTVVTPGAVRVEAWTFATWLSDAITRTPRDAADCPEDPRCAAFRTQYQLVNADGTAAILGAEGAATIILPAGFDVRATTSYAWGEAPDTRPGTGDARVPISRIPPLQGTAEARWREQPVGFHAGAALRWALAQDRLAPSDLSDARIPQGGTPGYSVFDLRAGWQLPSHLRVSVVFENVFDAAYRVHGSSINGPGRGVIAVAQGRL